VLAPAFGCGTAPCGRRPGRGSLTVALAIALAAALVGASIVFLVGYRRRGRGWDRSNGAVPGAPATERTHLELELQQAQLELRRTRQLAALSETLDLDDLLARLLQSATSLTNCDAAAVALWEQGETPIVKAMNLTAEEALPLVSGWRPEGQPRAVTIRYRLPREAASPSAVQTGLLLPLSRGDDTVLGILAAFWRGASEEPGEHELSVLEELTLSAGRAIENAREFRALHDLAVRDPLTDLHNRRHFHETLAHEVKRAHRYDRRLALIFFDLDDFKAINEEIGHLGGDAVLAEVAQRLSTVVRGADMPCRVGGDEFAVILPESSLEDAERFFQRLQLAIQGQPLGRVRDLQISAGIAELGRDDDATSLFRRVDQALYRAKRSGKGKVEAAEDPEELP
jgi:diguanylate cyclase (GGDEF)-like protein